MDINQITSMIASMGFPAVACVALFYLYKEAMENMAIQMQEILSNTERLLDKVADLMQEVDGVLK